MTNVLDGSSRLSEEQLTSKMERMAGPMVAKLTNTIAKMIQWLGLNLKQELEPGQEWKQEQAFIYWDGTRYKIYVNFGNM